MPAEGVSVVVPTRGGADDVDRLLRSLARTRAEYPGDSEVLLVDDTPGAERERLERAADRARARLLAGPRNVAAKRNLGARHALHELILFVDSDCVADERLLVTHAAAQSRPAPAGRPPTGAVAGPTLLEGRAATRAWRVADRSEVWNPPRWRMPHVDSAVAPWSWPLDYDEVMWAPTSNLSVRRDVFLEVGGFHERGYTHIGGEDVDLCLRLRAAGWTVRCDPEAVVRHSRDDDVGLSDLVRKEFLYGRSNVYNAHRHPEHVVPDANPAAIGAGAAAIAAATRSRGFAALATAAMAGWWARVALRARPPARDLPAALAAPALEWAFQAGIVAEALRRRSVAHLARRFDYFDERLFVPVGGAAA